MYPSQKKKKKKEPTNKILLEKKRFTIALKSFIVLAAPSGLFKTLVYITY